MIRFAIRYLAYIMFALAAIGLLIWAIPFSFGEPACVLEPKGCPEPTLFEQMVRMLKVIGSIPITCLVFVFYRRGVRKMLGYEDESYSYD